MKLIFWIQGFIIVLWIIETGYCGHQGKSKREKLDNLLKVIAKEDENTNIDDAENEWVEEEIKAREHNLHKRKKTRNSSHTFKKFVGSKYYVATVLGIVTVIMISCILHFLLCAILVQKVKAMNDDRPNKKTLNNDFKRRLSGILSTTLPQADSEQASLNLLPKADQSEHTNDTNSLQQSVSLLMKIGVVPDNVDLQTKRKASTIGNNENYSKGHNTLSRKTLPPSKKMSSSKTAKSRSALLSSQSGNISSTSPKVPLVISTPDSQLSSKLRKSAVYQTQGQQARMQVNPAQPGPSPAQQSRIIPITRTDTSSILSPIPSLGSNPLTMSMNNTPGPPPPPSPSNDQKSSGKMKRNNLLQSIQGGQQLKSSQDQLETVTKMSHEGLDFLGSIRKGNTLKPATQNSVNTGGHEKQITKPKNILDSIHEGKKLKSNVQPPLVNVQKNAHSEPVHQYQKLKSGNQTIPTDISKISQSNNKNSSDPTDFLLGIRQGKTLKCADDRIIPPKQDEGFILVQAIKSPKLKSVKQRIIPDAKKEEQMTDMLKAVKLKSVPPKQNYQIQKAVESKPKRTNAPPDNLLADLQTKRKASTIGNNENDSKGHNTLSRKTYGTIPPSKKMSSSKTAKSRSALLSSQSGNISSTSPKVPLVISTPDSQLSSKLRKSAVYQTQGQQARMQVNPAQPGPSPAQQSRIIPITRTDTSSILSPIPSLGSKTLITVMTAPSNIPLVTSVPLTMSMNNTSCQSDGSPGPPPPSPSNDQKSSGKMKRNNLLQSIQGGQQLKSSQDQLETVTKMSHEGLDFLGSIRKGNTLKPATQNSVNTGGHEKQITKPKNILDSIHEGKKLKSNVQPSLVNVQKNAHSEPVHQYQTLKSGNQTIPTDISKISQSNNKNSSDPTDFLLGIRQGKTVKCADDRIIPPKQDEGFILVQAIKSPKLKSVKQQIIPDAKKEEQMTDMLKAVKLKSVPPKQNYQIQEAVERKPKRTNAPPDNLLADLTGTLRNKFPTVVTKTFAKNYQWQTQSLPAKQPPKPDKKTDVREVTLQEIRQRPKINPNMLTAAFSK